MKLWKRLRRAFGANKIAMGHNRDDQVETILLRMIRGTGEDGLERDSRSKEFRILVLI